MALLAMFVAMLLDPVRAILGALGGAFCRRWWHLVIVAFVVAAACEVILASVQYSRGFDPVVFIVGVLAAAPWALAGFAISKRRRRE